MMKWSRDRWIAEILFHLVMVLGSFTGGCFLAPVEGRDAAVGIYIAAVMVCVAGLHIYMNWREP